MASQRGELGSEHAIATAKVQDAFALARREQIHHRRAEVSDEAGVARVAVRIPGLLVRHYLYPPE